MNFAYSSSSVTTVGFSRTTGVIRQFKLQQQQGEFCNSGTIQQQRGFVSTTAAGLTSFASLSNNRGNSATAARCLRRQGGFRNSNSLHGPEGFSNSHNTTAGEFCKRKSLQQNRRDSEQQLGIEQQKSFSSSKLLK